MLNYIKYYIKYYIGKTLIYFYNKIEDEALDMPTDTREESEACTAAINYNIDPDVCIFILKSATYYALNKKEKNKGPYAYYFTTHFYFHLFYYKIKSFITNVY